MGEKNKEIKKNSKSEEKKNEFHLKEKKKKKKPSSHLFHMSNRALEMSTRFFRLLPLAFCIPFKYKYPHLLYQSSENELHQTIRRRREEEFGKIIDSHTQKGTV